jgi:hypothetical protein
VLLIDQSGHPVHKPAAALLQRLKRGAAIETNAHRATNTYSTSAPARDRPSTATATFPARRLIPSVDRVQVEQESRAPTQTKEPTHTNQVFNLLGNKLVQSRLLIFCGRC